ncbi:MAG: hypothetical protein HY675_25295 [Chloroflexi bacterium]|nr:hypothetical protein [Chloroflexota bacterium]
MRIGFTPALIGMIAVGLGIGAAFGAYQTANMAKPAAANPRVQSNVAAPSAATGAEQSAQQAMGRALMGVVEKTGENDFVLRPSANASPVTVRVSSQTVIRKQVTGSVADIKPGERIAVRGEPKDGDSYVAASIQLVGADASGVQAQEVPEGQARGRMGQAATKPGSGDSGQGMPAALLGTVETVADGTITISRAGSSPGQTASVKVAISDKTVITMMATGDVKDITQGASVMVAGPRGADGVVAASTVQILPADSSNTRRRQ